MKLPKSILIILVVNFCQISIFSQNLGIDNIHEYQSILKNKNIGLVVNQTSQVNNTHLIDTLHALGMNISTIFSPEHGFSGKFNAGEYIEHTSYYDSIPIISLYGKNKKPNSIHLRNIDIIVFDIQDVGVRFYTYISTLHYVMESCAEQNIELLILDRPNPHTHYVDGPVLEKAYSSFVGMHPVPIVYGMTIGEYALMINGEGWLENQKKCNLKVVQMQSYSRFNSIRIQTPPSPNLRTMNSILLYPSLCLFEGTLISVGRGTDLPFEIYGAPFLSTDFSFSPEPNFGSKDPKYNGTVCYGFELKEHCRDSINKINLHFLIDAYHQSPTYYQDRFFNNFFNKLSGNGELQDQIINHMNENEIRETWNEGIQAFLLIRAKYLLYD